ncbi:MAG: nucleotidyltransferase family protein [Alphaproteobacteria bacterium]|nr:nucleotidyltransferase family protein [Alphaproteobacteria bacterium]NNF24189.1 nucleotidyltransferase family protein [Paracoccaceae bacterium]
MTPNAIMIFAAGKGTRMGALTRTRPKPLVRVSGRPLIDHALDVAAPLQLSRTVVNAHHFADQLADHLSGTGAVISYEEALLDTGGGLRAAADHLGGGTVFTLNSDAIWSAENPLLQLQAAWDEARMDALLLLVPLTQALGRLTGGDFSAQTGGEIRRGGDLVYTGAQIIRLDTLADMPGGAFSLNLAWDAMAERGRLFGAVYSGKWCDVGHPGGIELAEALLKARSGV